MKQFLGRISVVFVIAVTAPSMAEETRPAPNIEGTYRLISRTLPNGTMLRAPDVMGLYTVTKTHKSVNVAERDADGKLFFVTRVATYHLTASEYSETNIFTI